MITANKGEWSELYVLFKLLGEKKVHAGDGNLNKLEAYYPVLKVLRDELERHLEYSVNKDIVIITEDETEIARINVIDFFTQSKELFECIQEGGNGTGAFEIPSINDFLNKIHCEKVKAKSIDKADIHIVIHDYHTGMEPNLGFSIKSDAGAAPTLLNASGATTFTYEISGGHIDDNVVDSINSINGTGCVIKRVKAIQQAGAELKFSSVPNPIFDNNLRMIDSNLPEIIGRRLADCYAQKDMNIKEAAERISKNNPLNYNLSQGHDHYGYKIKSLMVATALGMLPSKPWSGRYEATGGYLVVKSDGDVICFHLYDRNLLEDYLFNNTKFETPSKSRYNMGEVYRNGDKYYFNLVLQIRFI